MRPGGLRRPAAGILVVLALAGCATGADPLARPSSGPSSAPAGAPSPSPTPAAPEAGVPLTANRPPADFQGDEARYVREVRESLARDRVPALGSDSRLLELGRELCSVLSGGGLLADKVEHWSGFRDLGEGADVAIVLAAQDVFCPELADGYPRLDLGEAVPTPAERADLARFVTTLDEPKLAERLRATPDEDLAEDAETACEIDFHGEWWDRTKAKRVAGSLPADARMDYVVGLVTGYCPKRADTMISSLEDFAG